MASQAPSMSLSSFFSLFHPSWLPDCRSPALPLATACWIKHCCSLSQQICLLHQIHLPSLYPITDGSSKLIQDLSRTNVTPCYCLKQMGPRSVLTDTSILSTWRKPMCLVKLYCMVLSIFLCMLIRGVTTIYDAMLIRVWNTDENFKKKRFERKAEASCMQDYLMNAFN